MQVSRRGKFNTLVHKDGSPIQAELYNCIVQREPHDTRGKTYATLDLTYARGAGVAVLQYVDARIRKEAAPEFSPLRPDNSLVVKVPAGGGVVYETRDGNAAAPFTLARGQAVDVIVRLGAYGSFGYCWLVHRVKPHDQDEP